MDKYVHIRGQVTIIKKLAAIRNTREGAKASKRHIRYIQNPDGAHLYSYSNIPVPQEVHALHANDPYARSDMCAQVTYQHIHERALKEEAILTMLAAAHAGSSAAQRNVASHRQGQIAIAGATTAGDAGHKRAPQLRGIHVAALAGRGSRKAHHPTPPATPPRGRHRTARRAPHTSMRPALQRDSTPRTGATMGKTTEQQRGNIAALAALTGMADDALPTPPHYLDAIADSVQVSNIRRSLNKIRANAATGPVNVHGYCARKGGEIVVALLKMAITLALLDDNADMETKSANLALVHKAGRDPNKAAASHRPLVIFSHKNVFFERVLQMALQPAHRGRTIKLPGCLPT